MKEFNPKELDFKTSKAKADKAIRSLNKILLKIDVVKQSYFKEVKDLKKWAKEHRSLIDRNPFKEFLTIIDQMTSNNLPETETIEDLYWLSQKYKNGFYNNNNIDIDINTLKQICEGILEDGIIDEEEVIYLEKWLEENSHLSTYYPYDELRSLLLSIIADGIIDEDEILVLKAFMNQFVVIENKEIAELIDKETENINISTHCTNEPVITFKGKTFCVTGVLKSGNRMEIENKIKNLGGNPTSSVTIKTDYLIVGDNGNSVWAFACYGRKVEKALEIKKSGHHIRLVHEYDFLADIEKISNP